MADRSVSIILDAKISGLVGKFKSAEKAIDGYAAKTSAFVRKNSSELSEIGTASAIAGAGIAAGVGLVIKSYADFDEQMSAVSASTHASTGDLELLRAKAVEVGADTKFSATEAAAGIDELSKAGVSVKDILGGGLTGAMDLAAAGGLGVAEASETAASAMTMFKLEGKDIPHIADLMAAGAGKAQGSVHDLGEALNQTGGIAALNGLSIEETSAALAAMASNGYLGSDAGTSFKTMLMNLKPTTEVASTMVEELGLHAYDAQGNFIGLEAYAGKLKKGLSGLSEEQRLSTLKTLFGTDAIRAASVMYEQGAEGIADWTTKVNDAGYAQETAALKMDNLKGDIENLGGSLDSVFLKSGSGANDVLRDLVQNTEGLVDWIGELDPKLLQATLGIAGVTGGALLLGGGFMTAVVKGGELLDAFGQISSNGGKTQKAIARVGTAAAGTAVAYGIFTAAATLANDKWRGPDETSVEGFTNAVTGMATGVEAASSAMDKHFDGANLGVTDLDSAIKRVFDPSAGRKFDDFMRNTFGQGDVSGINTTKDAFNDLDQSIAGMASSGNTEDAAAAFARVKESAEEQGVPIEELMGLFPEYEKVLAQAATEAGNTQLSQEQLAGAMDGSIPITEEVTESVEDQAKAMKDLLDIQRELGGGVLSQRDAERSFIDSLASGTEALNEYRQSLIDQRIEAGESKDQATAWADAQIAAGAALDLTTEAGRKNQDALDGVARSGWDLIEALSAAGASGDELEASMSRTREEFINAATAMGMGHDEAVLLADQLNLIPSNVNITVQQQGAAETGDEIDAVANKKRTAVIEVVSKDKAKILSTPKGQRGISKSQVPYKSDSPLAFWRGGSVRGPGTGTSDDIDARLSNGEYVVSAKAADAVGLDNLDAINRGLLPERLVPVNQGSSGTLHLSEADRKLFSRPTMEIHGAPGQDIHELGRLIMDQFAWEIRGS